MRINADEHVVGMIVIRDEETEVLTLTSRGYGKRTVIGNYPTQGRGGRGVLTMKTTDRVGDLVAIKAVTEANDLMIITQVGIMIRMDVGAISTMGRNTQGVRLIKIKDGDAIADVTQLLIEDDEKDGEGGEDSAAVEASDVGGSDGESEDSPAARDDTE